GSGGTASENSRSISSTTSRGASANSLTISASFDGISTNQRYSVVPGRPTDAAEHRLGVDLLGQVPDGHDPDEALRVVAHQHPPHGVIAHQQGRGVNGVLGPYGHQIPTNDLPDGRRRRIQAL